MCVFARPDYSHNHGHLFDALDEELAGEDAEDLSVEAEEGVLGKEHKEKREEGRRSPFIA